MEKANSQPTGKKYKYNLSSLIESDKFDFNNEGHLKALVGNNYYKIRKKPMSGLYSNIELWNVLRGLSYISVKDRIKIEWLFYEECRNENESAKFMFSKGSTTEVISGDRESMYCMRAKDERNYVQEIISKDVLMKVVRIVNNLKIKNRIKEIFLECCYEGGVNRELVDKYGYKEFRYLSREYNKIMLEVRKQIGIKVKGSKHIDYGNLDNFKMTKRESDRVSIRKRRLKEKIAEVNYYG